MRRAKAAGICGQTLIRRNMARPLITIINSYKSLHLSRLGWLVTWTLDADLGRNPVKRWAGLALGALMGGDMEKGLANLKRELETSR